MRIISTTQTHNAQEQIGDALRSVLPFVDACLVVDSGVTDRTFEIARRVACEKLITRKFDWKNDFSMARNYHLLESDEMRFDWAITLDTDERINGLTREYLETTDADIVNVRASNGTYEKNRAFRLPAKGRWRFPVHEAFIPSPDAKAVTHPTATFDELPKSREALIAKLKRCVEILTVETKKENSSWLWYYLGDSHEALASYLKIPLHNYLAIQAFHSCVAAKGGAEEAAIAMFHAAHCHLCRQEPEDAIKCAIKGMGIHQGVPDIPWIGALACMTLKEPRRAIYFASIAAALGFYSGCGGVLQRAMTRHWAIGWAPLYEGPYEILAWAYHEIGLDYESQQALTDGHAAKQMRIARHGQTPMELSYGS
jgi:tetratricopeptide (TPR) repeat protein